MNCKNCNTEINSNFCPNCGQPAVIKRINGHYIVHEIEHVLHFERGILFTIRELLTNPGQNIKNYLLENRSRLVKPIIFIIITSLIYTLTIHFFHIEDQYIKIDTGNTETNLTKIFKWIQDHYGYSNIMIGVFIAFFIKIFFSKSNYNYYEILILLCFVMGIAMLIFSVFAIIEGLTNINLMAIGGIIGIGYCTWAIGNFFGKKNMINYLKAFFAYILGLIFFSITALLLGFLIDKFI